MIELRDACSAYGIEAHAFCLMDNHYHLLLHPPAGQLSAMMQRLSARYTQAANLRHDRDGPIFRGRFNSVLVEGNEQLMQTSLYIHRNPVAAGLAKAPWDWRWSSAADYVGKREIPDWLRTRTLLAMIGAERAEVAYAELLAAPAR